MYNLVWDKSLKVAIKKRKEKKKKERKRALGVCVFGVRNPGVWQRWACCSSMAPGSAERKTECVPPVGAHTQSTDTLVHMASHTDRQHWNYPVAGPWSPWSPSCMHTHTHTYAYIHTLTYSTHTLQSLQFLAPQTHGHCEFLPLFLWQALGSICTDAEQRAPLTREMVRNGV